MTIIIDEKPPTSTQPLPHPHPLLHLHVFMIACYCLIYAGTQSADGSHVSFSIEPNGTVAIERNSPAQIIWQIQDTRCEPNGWRAEVGVRSETLLLYPRANQSAPNENYSNYSVTAVRGECEEGAVQRVDIIFTVFVGEHDVVNFTDYIFCEIFVPGNTNPIRSVACLYLVSSTTATEPITSAVSGLPILPDTTTVNEILSTSSSQSYHSGLFDKQMHYLLMVCTVLVLSILSVK